LKVKPECDTARWGKTKELGKQESLTTYGLKAQTTKKKTGQGTQGEGVNKNETGVQLLVQSSGDERGRSNIGGRETESVAVR